MVLLHFLVLSRLVLSDSLQPHGLWPNLMDCSPPGSSVPGDSPGKNTGVGCHAILQRIVPTRGSNPDLLNCRWILYCLNHKGNPWILEWELILSAGEFSDPGIEPGSPELQADSLPAEITFKFIFLCIHLQKYF